MKTARQIRRESRFPWLSLLLVAFALWAGYGVLWLFDATPGESHESAW